MWQFYRRSLSEWRIMNPCDYYWEIALSDPPQRIVDWMSFARNAASLISRIFFFLWKRGIPVHAHHIRNTANNSPLCDGFPRWYHLPRLRSRTKTRKPRIGTKEKRRLGGLWSINGATGFVLGKNQSCFSADRAEPAKRNSSSNALDPGLVGRS